MKHAFLKPLPGKNLYVFSVSSEAAVATLA
jgi:hypothetical protein